MSDANSVQYTCGVLDRDSIELCIRYSISKVYKNLHTYYGMTVLQSIISTMSKNL